MSKAKTKNYLYDQVKSSRFVAYISHPTIGDNLDGNLIKIENLIHHIIKNYPFVNPITPYYMSYRLVDEGHAGELQKAVEMNYVYFEKGFFDELWLAGDEITFQMATEIRWALKFDIPIYCFNPHLKTVLEPLVHEYGMEFAYN